MDYLTAYNHITEKMLSWNFVITNETSTGFDLGYFLGHGSYDCSEPDPLKKKRLDYGSFNGNVRVVAKDFRVTIADADHALDAMKDRLRNHGQFDRIKNLF